MTKLSSTAVLLLSADLTLAQDLSPGARVRITRSSGPPIVGTLDGADDSHLTVTPRYEPGPTRVDRSVVTRVEVSRGQRRQPLEGACAGFGIGLVVGAAAGIGAYHTGNAFTSPVQGVAVFGGVVGGAGALVGGAVGALSEADIWEELPPSGLRVSVAPGPNAGVNLRVRLSW